MEIDFTNQEAMFIHGRFKLEMEELKAMKEAPDCPFDARDLDQRIESLSSIILKLEDTIPNLAKMNPYLERIAAKKFTIRP